MLNRLFNSGGTDDPVPEEETSLRSELDECSDYPGDRRVALQDRRNERFIQSNVEYSRQTTPTCLIKSVRNALHALGLEDRFPSFVLRLDAIADFSDDDSPGDKYEDIMKIVLSVRDGDQEMDIEPELVNIEVKPSVKQRNRELRQSRDVLIAKTAAEIQSNINETKRLVTAINYTNGIYKLNNPHDASAPKEYQDDLHAILIDSYRVDDNGFMDVRVIDPNFPDNTIARWIPLEHFVDILSDTQGHLVISSEEDYLDVVWSDLK